VRRQVYSMTINPELGHRLGLRNTRTIPLRDVGEAPTVPPLGTAWCAYMNFILPLTHSRSKLTYFAMLGCMSCGQLMLFLLSCRAASGAR
jgi:hypothetical protein